MNTFDLVSDLKIGHIVEVSGTTIRIELAGDVTELTRTYEGRVYPIGQIGSIVKVHYTGTLLDGTKFDSSRDKNEPWEFTLGAKPLQAIKGFDEGITMMKKGGKATLIIPSTIGYGERDMGQIPPYSTLVFDIELIDVQDAAPPAAPVKK